MNTTIKLRNGDYIYRGHRITKADWIACTPNLKCEYDWQPLWSKWKGGGYFDWYISKEPYDFPFAIESRTACDYQHDQPTLKGAKDMIDNHIDCITGSEHQLLKESLGIANKLLTSADFKILSEAQGDIREQIARADCQEKYNNLVEIVWDIIGSDKANGSWSFEETSKEVINTLRDLKHIHI